MSKEDDEAYQKALRALDIALCNAMAVSQGSAMRHAEMNIGFATMVFTRLCAHGECLIRAVPRSRWSHAEYELWDFSAGASHARTLLGS